MIAALRALTLGAFDLARPRVMSVVLLGIGLTVALFLCLQGLVFWGLVAWGPDHVTLPWFETTIPLGEVLAWTSLGLFPVLALFVGAPVAVAFCGLFTDRVAGAVEAAHGYPVGREPDFVNGLLDAFAMLAAALAITLVLLVLTPFVGPLAPVLFYAANGWLLGREFLTAAARRHLTPDAAAAFRGRHVLPATLVGAAVMGLLTVPFLNLLGPVLAAAAATHLFWLLSAYEGRSSGYRRG